MTTVWCSYKPRAERLSKGERARRKQKARAVGLAQARQRAKAAYDAAQAAVARGEDRRSQAWPVAVSRQSGSWAFRRLAHMQAWMGKLECYWCKRPLDLGLQATRDPWRPTIEHLVPQSLGGTNHPDNLEAACYTCNTLRGFLMNPKHQVRRDPASSEEDRRFFEEYWMRLPVEEHRQKREPARPYAQVK